MPAQPGAITEQELETAPVPLLPGPEVQEARSLRLPYEARAGGGVAAAPHHLQAAALDPRVGRSQLLAHRLSTCAAWLNASFSCGGM